MRRFWVVAPNGSMQYFSTLIDKLDYLRDHPEYRPATNAEKEVRYQRERPKYVKKG